MSVLTRSDFQQLVEERQEPCLSLTMPTRTVSGRDNQQEPIRFKNLVRQAERQLQYRGLRSREIEAFLKPLQAYLVDSRFWSYQSDGLAMFLTPKSLRLYRLPCSLPEEVTVADRFRLKPLIGLLNELNRFALLALSLNGIRLLECGVYGFQELELEGMPESFSRWKDHSGANVHLQARSVTAGGGGGGATMIHGHADTGEDVHALRGYLREVDRVLSSLLSGLALPVMFSGVDHVVASYREICSYSQILPQVLSGSPERIHAGELYRQAWDLFLPQLRQRRLSLLAGFKEQEATGLASNDWNEVLSNLGQGRVESLVLREGLVKLGRLDRQSFQVDWAVPEEDLAEWAAITAYLHGGKVYTVEAGEIPGGADMQAFYRY